MGRIYDTLEWDAVRERVLERDGHRCVIGALVGSPCHETLYVHHLIPVEDGGDPLAEANLICVCHSHHPRLEAFRRQMVGGREQGTWRCPHRHTTAEGRRQCEERRRRARLAA